MSDFKPEVVSQLDDLIKRKGKPAQKPEENQEKGSITQTSHEGVNINAQGDVHYHAAPQPTLPSINEMTKKDRKAFDEGTWDGIEKRSHKSPKKEEQAAKRRHQRRLKDRQDHILHYALLILLSICLFGSLAIGVLTEL